MDDCVFCNIANRTIEAEILFENERVFAIRDILPKAPVHILVIPKEHIRSISHTEPRHEALLGEMMYTAKLMGEKFGVQDTGYKLIFNVGRDGGQVISHLHLHLLGGKQMGE